MVRLPRLVAIVLVEGLEVREGRVRRRLEAGPLEGHAVADVGRADGVGCEACARAVEVRRKVVVVALAATWCVNVVVSVGLLQE